MVNYFDRDYILDEDELAYQIMNGFIKPSMESWVNGLPHNTIPDYSNSGTPTSNDVSNWRVLEYYVGAGLGKIGVAGLFVPDPIPLIDEIALIGAIALGVYLMEDSGYTP